MRIGPQRPVNPDAIVAPQGYRVEALITGLTFPSAISFGTGGELYLAEAGGVAGSVVAVPRVLRVDPDQTVSEIGRLENPIVGLVYREGELLIAEDGPSPRILLVTAEGEVRVLVEGLPGGGDYGLSGLAQDGNGGLLFGIGTRTNSGVVGLDNVARGWVSQYPDRADIPGADVELAGVNYVTTRPTHSGTARVTTGGFKPFGVRSESGEKVSGSQRCGGAVYRLPADSTELERLAWGLRNPVGVGCAPDGRIFATEGGMEERGSRPIAGAPDNFWEIRPGSYYGWPDHASGMPVTDPRFRLPGYPAARRLLADTPPVNGSPLTLFPARAGVGRFDFSVSEGFGHAGEAFVALSGEWSAAAYAGEDVALSGNRVVRVDIRSGNVTDFLVNRQAAPSSAAGNSGGLERPFDVAFDPTGEVLYVVDLGEIRLNREFGLEPFGGTGVVWRITKIRPMLLVNTPTTQTAQPAPEPTTGVEILPATDDLEATAEEPQELPEEDAAEFDGAEAAESDADEESDEESGVEETEGETEAEAGEGAEEAEEAAGAVEDGEAPGLLAEADEPEEPTAATDDTEGAETEDEESESEPGAELIPEGEPAPEAPAETVEEVAEAEAAVTEEAVEEAEPDSGPEATVPADEAPSTPVMLEPQAETTAVEAGPVETEPEAAEEAVEAAEAEPAEAPTVEAAEAPTADAAEATEPVAEEPLALSTEEPAASGDTADNPAPGAEPEAERSSELE